MKRQRTHIESDIVAMRLKSSLNKGSFFLMLLVFVTGCIEPFDVTYENDTSNVVVTGSITDQVPARVEIARPAETNHTRVSGIRKVTGATVTLSDDLGFQEVLQETSKGIYQGVTKGIVGRSYHIEVTLPDDSQIKSTPQLLKPCPSIDKLELEQVSFGNPISENIKVEVIGLNLNIHVDRKDTVSHFYKWSIGGTYEMYTAYNMQGKLCKTIDSKNDSKPCYVSYLDYTNFTLGESVSKDADLISKKLKFLSPNSTYLYGHSLEVSQYSMTKDAFDYWSKVEGQQKGVGSVFDPPPAQIIGNLRFIDDKQSNVMGFFEASSVKKRRVFLDRSNFKNLDPDSPNFFDDGINEPCFDRWPGTERYLFPYDYCCDCSLHDNSTRTKPSFWPQ
jgi:hypothetical protein